MSVQESRSDFLAPVHRRLSQVCAIAGVTVHQDVRDGPGAGKDGAFSAGLGADGSTTQRRPYCRTTRSCRRSGLQTADGAPCGDIFVNFFDPPTAGSSDNTFYVVNERTNFAEVSTNMDIDNGYFEIVNVPEPATVGAAFGLFDLMVCYKQRRGRGRPTSGPAWQTGCFCRTERVATFRRKIDFSERPSCFRWLFGDAPVALSGSRARRREAECPGSMSGPPEHFPC